MLKNTPLLGRLLPAAAFGLALATPAIGAETTSIPTWRLQARLVAVGLPGVAGVRQIGRFHSGGPIPANPEFLLSMGDGRILDPERVMVAVSSNFGAPPGHPLHAAGAILSIDPRGAPMNAPLLVPNAIFSATAPSDATAGAVLLYTSQSATFQNRLHNAGAFTADFTAASGPRYLSMNNAFGRPWVANAPQGLAGDGSVTVVDPSGRPLDHAPSSVAGGVFAGRMTDRKWVPKAQPSSWIAKLLNYRASGQLTPGSLTHGALGTAFLGPSPDGSGLAVFAVVTADGAVLQVHVQDGVDGLAPPGTISAVDVNNDPGVIGIAFKWHPERVLYVADAGGNRLVLLHLDDDRRHFTLARTSSIVSPALNRPIDVAAAVPEIANPRFSSHTTLAGLSDLYVANRGDGSLLRVTQTGHVLARAEVEVPGLGLLGPNRIRGLAVSADAQRMWVTLQGEVPGFAGYDGVLIEISAFDAAGPFSRDQRHLDAKLTRALRQVGEEAFQREFSPETGLGPLFNARACVTCHPGPGGMSSREEHFVRRAGHMDPVTGRVVPIEHPNSPVARRHSTREIGQRDAPWAALPRNANVVSLRMPLSLYATAQLDDIPDIVIIGQAVSKGDGIKGRPHFVTSANGEVRVGRYGWKAHSATLEEMVAEAFANELGITNPGAPEAQIGLRVPAEDDGSLVRAVTAYLRGLRVPSGDPQR